MTRPRFVIGIGTDAGGGDWGTLPNNLFDILAHTGSFYRDVNDNIMFLVGNEFKTLTDREAFAGAVHQAVSVRKAGDRGEEIRTMIPEDLKRLFWNAPLARRRLPLVQVVFPLPVVIGPDLIEPGYNGKHKVYVTSKQIKPRSGTEHLEKCFSAIPFATPAHRSNYFAWLLGGVLGDIGISQPLLVLSGNQQRVGKTTLANAAAEILGEPNPGKLNFNMNEFRKTLSAVYAAGKRVALMDNVDTSGNPYRNAILAEELTGSKSTRLLGHSRDVSGAGTRFILTCNNAKLDKDLASRAIDVHLHSDEPCYPEPYPVTYAEQHQKQIYGELLGIALEKHKRPLEKSGFRCVQWSRFVKPRVEKHFGPVDFSGVASDLDAEVVELFNLGETLIADDARTEALSASELAERLFSLPAFDERKYRFKTDKARQTSIGQFLKGIVGREVVMPSGMRLALRCEHDKKNKSNRYHWEVV
jgi:hypothetical protein